MTKDYRLSPPGRQWTQQEEEFLSQRYGLLSREALMIALQRAPGSIHAKAHKLGLAARGVVMEDGLKDVDKAYLAGLFDGEGSLSAKRKDKPNWTSYILRISNTHKDTIDWLMSSFGGHAIITTDNRKNGGKICYGWTLARKADIAKFLLMVLPYLRIKKELAQRALPLIEKSFGGKKWQYP